MIKKILPISVFVLLVVIIVLLGLQNLTKKNSSQIPTVITPKLVKGEGYYRNIVNTREKKSPLTPQTPEEIFQNTQVMNEVRAILPVTTEDFDVEYSGYLDKIIISKKTEKADKAVEIWVAQNGFADIVKNNAIFVETTDPVEIYEDANMAPEKKAEKIKIKSMVDFFSILMSPLTVPSITITVPPTPTITPEPEPTKKVSITSPPKPPAGNYVYYPQCGGPYDEYLLPIQNGTGGKKCTICSAGCGPTTASMILSSYVDSSLTPPKVVDAMGKAGVDISCNGSGMYELYDYMGKVSGIKVSSLLSLGHAEAKEVVGDFRGYIKGGWTLFVLADCKYGGHYFWVTDVTDDGNILAYDPAYGVGKPTPFNENQYDPHPYYIYAFAVKKS